RCRKLNIETSTTSDLNIYPYLQTNASQFSEWAKIVDKSGYAGFLTAYGAYTMFAPTNDAVKTYLSEVNKTSVDAFTVAEAKDLVAFHLLQDTIPTNLFKDGKLPTVTMFGQYLVVSTVNTAGVSSITINRQAIVTQGNIITGNGYIHAIDHVLKPATKSSGQVISDNPNLSIFKQALVATGYYDTIDIINTSIPKRFFTVIAETNKDFADSGFASYTALFNRLSTTGNPKDPTDSLHIYVAYHILPEAKYLADIASASSHATLQPLEVISSKLVGEKIILNDLDFNGVHEQGVELDRATSDVSTTTGVLHMSLAHFHPKARTPFPVYWDVADFPEVRKLSSVFRKSNINFAYGSIKDINWNNPANSLAGDSKATGYTYTGVNSSNFFVYYGDCLNMGMGTTSRHNWIDFRTPLLVKGKYNIWVCYRTAKTSTGSNMPINVYFDGQLTSRTFNFCVTRPTGSDGELLALGWKIYTENTSTLMAGKFVGVVDVTTTDRHMIRLEANAASGTGQPSNYLDMIHFIPVDWPSQFLPRFRTDGTLIYF
ncbi:MAG TPA: fasciclin domain-containing protein, partial [Hanamia sp.]